MTSPSTKPDCAQPSKNDASCRLFDDWFDPIEHGIRERVRSFIEEMIRTHPVKAALRGGKAG